MGGRKLTPKEVAELTGGRLTAGEAQEMTAAAQLENRGPGKLEGNWDPNRDRGIAASAMREAVRTPKPEGATPLNPSGPQAVPEACGRQPISGAQRQFIFNCT